APHHAWAGHRAYDVEHRGDWSSAEVTVFEGTPEELEDDAQWLWDKAEAEPRHSNAAGCRNAAWAIRFAVGYYEGD
ncbi:unnamed protein product, partial [marine sediment metagenome]